MTTMSKALMATVIATTLFSRVAIVSASDTVETRTECTTGAYGQQTCKTVEVKKVLGTTTPSTHPVKNTGVAENVMLATVAMFAMSLAGLVVSKR